MKRRLNLLTILIFSILTACHGQKSIPMVYSKIQKDPDGRMYIEWQGRKAYRIDEQEEYSLAGAIGNPEGTATGISFNFNDPGFTGILYYGFIHYNDGKHPLPVYFREFVVIRGGKAHINIQETLGGIYDMVGWQESGKGTLGYRMTGLFGNFIYDGKVYI